MFLCRSRFGSFYKCLIRNSLPKTFNQQSHLISYRQQASPLLAINNSSFIMAASNIVTAPKHTNRLAHEKSPYLLQHAHNPVDWYPWSDEAIQRARDENKLIFLSVGYSTCHWCHVMEKESFENEAIAQIMNEHFVNIKIDREERPDLDKLYMTFILLINGSGGWPMSVWLTPNLEPVTGGTYFPPTDRWGMPGFSTILQKVALKWRTNPEDFKKSGASIIAAIEKNVSERGDDEAGETSTPSVEAKFKQAVTIFKRNYDKVWGGSSGAPKFPEVSKLNLMLHAHVNKPDIDLLEVLTTTLDKMDNGGIHDHVFGGFARYSVDKKWHVPHFEKMLYDQGQLLRIYANTYKVTRRPRYLAVADKIFQYLMADLRHPGGGFYSGEDADSLPTAEAEEKIEGAFYAWTHEEIERLVNDHLAEYGEVATHPFTVFAHHYDVRENGNVDAASDPHGHLTGKNILFVNGSMGATAKKFNMAKADVERVLTITNRLLHQVRNKRPRPHLDTKIICAWNGLVLTGLAKLAGISDAPNRQQYLEAAKKQVEFMRQNLYDATTKKLYRSCYGQSDTEAAGMLPKPIHGFLDDYAFLIKGLIDYYVATLDKDALTWAKELQDTQNRLFWDDKNSGYFYSEADSPNVVVRLKEDHDGAEPCGNSIAAHNLFLLHGYFEDDNYLVMVKKLFAFFANVQPFGYVLPEMLSAQIVEEFGLNMLVVIGPDNDAATTTLFDVMRNFHIPGFIALHMRPGQEQASLLRQSAMHLKMVRNMPTAYICHNKVCHMPVTDPLKLRNEMQEKFVLECDKCK